MSIEYISTTGFAYFGFATNDPADGAADDADSTPSAFVREVGATASDAPITTGVTVSLLSHANYPVGCYEVEVDADTAGLSADTRYDVFVSATVNSTVSVAHIGRIVTTELLNAAAIQQECEDALGVYDPPTKAEQDSAFAALNDVSTTEIRAALLAYFQVLARSDAALASDLSASIAEINADEGSGAGGYNNQLESLEAIKAASGGGGGGGGDDTQGPAN